MSRITTALAIFTGTFLFIGCNSDSGTGPGGGGGTVTERLTGKNWRVTAMTVNPGIDVGGGVILTDLYAQMEDCEKDNTTNFNVNGTFTDDEGATKCDLGDPQTTSGTWVLNPAETVITLTEGGETESWTISSLTSTSTTVTYTADLGDGINRTFTITAVAP